MTFFGNVNKMYRAHVEE